MIVYDPTGDIFESKAKAWVNPVNCIGVMGKGLAAEFKERFPRLFKAYHQHCLDHKMQIGQCYLWRTNKRHPDYIINLPTKFHWRDKSQLRWVADSLDSLIGLIEVHNIHSIAIPQLGCGLGGLDWSDVRALIIERLKGLDDVDVTLYGPAAERDAA